MPTLTNTERKLLGRVDALITPKSRFIGINSFSEKAKYFQGVVVGMVSRSTFVHEVHSLVLLVVRYAIVAYAAITSTWFTYHFARHVILHRLIVR